MDIYKALPSTRAEAARMDAKKYFTGKPCSQGHVAPRYAAGACTLCQNAATSKWASLRPAKVLAYAKRHQAKYPDRHRGRSLAYARSKLPAPTRLAPTACECCGKPFKATPRLDHCHNAREFRGWLCNTCNRGIGMLGDDVAGVERAVAYLKRWQPPRDSNSHLTALEADALPLS